ncbi:MAG: DUF2225 domain-containing protein [Gemmatimonadaceae bacterium]
MTTLETIHLTCPNCAFEFDSSRADTRESHGRKHTDFQPPSDGASALQHGVHLCKSCGFAGPEQWFANSDGISYDVQRHVWDELTPRVSGQLPTSERYEFAARVAIWDGADARNIADLWLRAAWCCVDERDTEAERFYRRHAARSFEECLDAYDGVPRDERATLAYLVGELWRRIGDQARAKEWFERVANEVVDPYRQAWLLRLTKQQHHDPREWFA